VTKEFPIHFIVWKLSSGKEHLYLAVLGFGTVWLDFNLFMKISSNQA
jgi:hypothetical protein